MSIGTTQYLPLGITVYHRRGPTRRRRVLVVCAACTVGMAGYLIVDRITAKLANERVADFRRAAEAPAKSPSISPAADAPIFTAPIQPATAPNPSSAAAAVEPASVPDPEPPSLPTIIRGAGIRPR